MFITGVFGRLEAQSWHPTLKTCHRKISFSFCPNVFDRDKNVNLVCYLAFHLRSYCDHCNIFFIQTFDSSIQFLLAY